MKSTPTSKHHFKSKKADVELRIFSWNDLPQARMLANLRLVARIEIHQNLLRSIRRYTTFFNICAEGILDLETLAWHSCDEKGFLNLETFTLSKKKQDYDYNQQKSFDGFLISFKEIQYQRYKETTPVPTLEITWGHRMDLPYPRIIQFLCID